MRRITFNIILAAGFICLAIWIIRPFMADMYFTRAQKTAATYQWAKAHTRFAKAISRDPFDSRYYAGLGEFLLYQSNYTGFKRPLLKKAEGLFENAIKLNPGCADYWVKLGQIQLNLFIENKNAEPELIKSGFDRFRQALKNDSNGFNVSYQVGYAGIVVWKFLNDGEKALILDRLRYSLKLKRRYSKHIYPSLWKVTGDFKLLKQATPENLKSNEDLYGFISMNNLWEFRKEEKKAVDYYRHREEPKDFEEARRRSLDEIAKTKKTVSRRSKVSEVVLPESWHGRAFDGKNVFKNGNMPWSGTIHSAILAPSGSTIIKIQAKGSAVNGIYPYMVLQLDGKDVGETFVNSPEWKEYEFKVNSNGGIKVLSVTFVNDETNPKKSEDRNLFIGEAKFDKQDL